MDLGNYALVILLRWNYISRSRCEVFIGLDPGQRWVYACYWLTQLAPAKAQAESGTLPPHQGHGADQLWVLMLAAVIVFTYIQKYIQTRCIILSVTFKYATIHPYAWIRTLLVFTCCLISAEPNEWGSSSQSWNQFTEHSATNASPLQEDQFQPKYPP